MLQLEDTSSMLAMPTDLQDHEIEDNLVEPGDLGTVRAKLHEGYYASLEHFERDVFSVTSKAKASDEPGMPLHKVASCIEEKAAQIFHSLRTQPGFELQILNWAGYTPEETGQLSLLTTGGTAAVETGGASSSQWQTAPGGTSAGKEPVSTLAYQWPCPTNGSTGVRRNAHARASGAGTRRYRRKKASEPPTVSDSRAGKQPQCPPEDRRWTYLRGDPRELYGMVVESHQQLVRIATDMSYEESLMRFAQGGGPVAQRIAQKYMEDQRADVINKMERRNQLPLAPAAHWRPPLPRPPTAHGGAISCSKQGEAGGPPAAVYDPSGVGGFSFPAPSTGASAFLPGFGAPYCPTSNVVNPSGTTSSFKSYPHAANVPPSTVVGKMGPPGSSAGQGSRSGFWLGPRNVDYTTPPVHGATPVVPGYLSPPQAPQPNISDLFQLGTRSKNAGSSSGKLPMEPFDGFQYLLSASDNHLVGSGPVPSGGLGGATSADGSASQDLKGKQAAVQPETRPSQAVFDLKLLQSRLGENPWGNNGISSLRPWSSSSAIVDNPSYAEAGPSSGRPAEPSTLDLFGGRKPDLNLYLGGSL